MMFDEISGAQSLYMTTETYKMVAARINEPLANNDGTDVETTQIANLAIAVGIKEKRREQPENPNKTVKMDSLDQDKLLRTMIERRHADASPEELKGYMQGYLEGGIQEMSEEIEQNNHFNYHKYLDDNQNRS